MPTDAEHLRLLKARHERALAFIEHMGLRMEYDRWMTEANLASEFITQPRGGKLMRELADVGEHRQ